MIQLQFITPSEAWVESLCAKDSAIVKVLSMKLDRSNQNISHFVDITSEKKSAEELKKQLRRSRSVTESNVTSLGKRRVVGIVTSNNCKVGLIIMKSSRKAGLLGIASALTVNNSQMNYKLYMKGEGIPEFLRSLRKRGISYKIAEVERLFTHNLLGPKQKRVLKSALERGYFDHPKRISKELLSKKLGLRANSVSEVLGKAEKKIIRESSEQLDTVDIRKKVRSNALAGF
jgi:predicted DNA binding protein